jgi:predicted transglutaminase-like cysteine proteinase
MTRTFQLPMPTGPLWRRRWRAACVALACWAVAVQAWDPDRLAQSAVRHGDAAVQGVRALRQAAGAVLGRDDMARIVAINDFYNRHLAFREDIDNWGQTDYWASPLESLQRGQADCEDYAIAKYFTLVSMGVPHRRLRLVYVRIATGGLVLPHMVLTYYQSPDAEPYVLDNLVGDVRRAGRRPDLSPVFSFNADGLWEGAGPVAVGGAGPAERLSRWRDVLVKARQDGFFQ